jgi:hypothetical protein
MAHSMSGNKSIHFSFIAADIGLAAGIFGLGVAFPTLARYESVFDPLSLLEKVGRVVFCIFDFSF